MVRTGKKFAVLTLAVAALVLLVALPAGVAAATLFADNFTSGNLNNWTTGGTVAVISGGTYAPSWGGYYAQFSGSNYDSNDETITVTINSQCYKNIALSFQRRTYSLDSGEWFYVLYDDDTSGTNWQTLASYGGGTNPNWGPVTLSLPSSANNNAGFRIQFNLDYAADALEYAFLDNVTVTGDAMVSLPSVMNVTKTAKGGTGPYKSGDIITYNITVCNFGGASLTNVTINDPLLGFAQNFGTVDPTECKSWESNYQVTDADASRGWINNTVYVSANDTCGNLSTSYNVTVTCQSQTWYLSNTLDGVAGRYIMHRGGPGGTSGTPTIASGGTAIWRANESAQNTAVTFPAGNWTFIARRTDGTGTRDIDVSIGVWDGSAFTAYGTVRGILPGSGGGWGTFTISATGFTVPQGQWLAFRVQNNHGGSSFSIDAQDPDRSSVTSPCSDPGYPSVIPPGTSLNVTKVAETGPGPYSSGQTITYNITVCNPGNVTLTNVWVNDPLLGFNHVFGTLAQNECNWTKINYTVTYGDAVTGWINNTVCVYNGSTLYNQSYENVTVCNSQTWCLSSTTYPGYTDRHRMYRGGQGGGTTDLGFDSYSGGYPNLTLSYS